MDVTLGTLLKTGDERTVSVDDISQLYRSGASLPIPSEGKINRLGDKHFSLISKYTVVDCDTSKSIRNFDVYSLDKTENGLLENVWCVSQCHEVSDIIEASSENGRFKARLHTEKPLLEIWEHGTHLKTIDTSKFEFHGSVNADAQFGSFAWSKSGEQDKLLYVCQAKRPKYLSFLADRSESDEPERLRGQEHNRKEDWGESLNGIDHTMVAILDVGNNFKVTIIDVKDHSLGSPQWLDDCSKIVSVAYLETPRRLGVIYCNNRPSKLMVHDWQSQKVLFEFSNEKECFHSPRASNAGNRFVYLSNPVFGAHRHAVNLSICDIRTGTNTRLASEIFIETLPQSPFSTDDSLVLFTTFDHLYMHLNLCDVNSSKITNVKFPTTGINLLDFHHDIIFASGSEVNATPTLFVAVIDSKRPDDVVAWHQIKDCIHLNEVIYQAFKIPTEDQISFVSALLVKPNLAVLREKYPGRESVQKSSVQNVNQLPTVAIVHGGPHSNFIVSYYPSLVFYARLGLNSLLINYRGSLGVSEEYNQSLCGKVGELDVGDCMTVLRHFAKSGMLDTKKLVIQGGSHGGFLGLHLSCQDEFKFTSAIIRNPVVDISSLHTISDIPDWCYTEALGHKRHDYSWAPGGEDLVKMFECSPISKVGKCSVPTLMLVGSKDKRVPMSQGEMWVDLLRARGVKTLCKIYPDKHDLAKADVSADHHMTAAIWILQNLNAAQ